MTKPLPCAPLAVLALCFPLQLVSAQALPADPGTPPPGIGFALPRLGGNLSYAVSASELLSNGFYNNSGVSFTTNLSGDVAYVSKSQFHPFSAVYNGGILLANSGQPTSFYQGLSFSQVLSTKRWNIVLADSVDYLPESPVAGLSGIPGVGDVGVDPIAVGPASGIGILTTYGPRVSNTTSGTVSRQLTGRISAQGTGYFAIQRFIGDNSGQGLSTTTEGGSGGLTYRISARDAITGSYNYSNFSFSNSVYSFTAQGATINYSRQWSPRLSTNVYAGPQIIGGSNPVINGNSTQIAAGANASYLSRTTAYTLGYSRGVNNGSGVIPGAFSDNIILAAHHQLGRTWSLSSDIGYTRSHTLPNFDLGSYSSNSVALSGQVTRGLGRYFSAFGSYTLEDQSTSVSGAGYGAANSFNGVYQILGLGITYSPRNIPLSR